MRKKHELRELPCIIWKDTSKSDIALAQLIEIAHKHEYTDEEKATAIPAVYMTIGIKPKQSIQFVQLLPDEEYRSSHENKVI
jgi:hypothetical protein